MFNTERNFRKSAAIYSIFVVQKSYGYCWKSGGIPVSKIILRVPNTYRKPAKLAFFNNLGEGSGGGSGISGISENRLPFSQYSMYRKVMGTVGKLVVSWLKSHIAGAKRLPEAG